MVEPRSQRWAWAVAALAVSIVLLLPLVFLVSGSLRQPGLPPPRTPQLVPDPLACSNYERAVELVDLGRATAELAARRRARRAAERPRRLVGRVRARAASPRGSHGRCSRLSFVALMVPLTALLVPRFALFQHARPHRHVRAAGRTRAARDLAALRAGLLRWRSGACRRDLYDACRLEGHDAAARSGGGSRCRSSARSPPRSPRSAFVLTWSNFLDPLVYLYDRDLFTAAAGAQLARAARPDELPAAARRRGDRDGARRGRVPRRAALVPPRATGGRGWLGR